MTTTNIIEIVTPPASEPITKDELKLHMRLNSGTSEDNELDILIAAARQQFEDLTDGRVCISTTFRQHLTRWPTSNRIELQRGKVSSLTSVSYYDEDDELQTLDDPQLDATGTPALVYLPGNDWPNLSENKLRPITVEFVAGWADAASVPSDVKLGLLLLCGHWYERRETYTEANLRSLPQGFERFCEKYKTGLARW